MNGLYFLLPLLTRNTVSNLVTQALRTPRPYHLTEAGPIEPALQSSLAPATATHRPSNRSTSCFHQVRISSTRKRRGRRRHCLLTPQLLCSLTLLVCTLRGMDSFRRQLCPTCPSFHGYPYPQSRRLGNAGLLHMQQQQQHLTHQPDGAQAVSALRPLHWDHPWP